MLAENIGQKQKGKKKAGVKLWMSIDVSGRTEFLEADKYAVTKKVPIPIRDLRVLGPLFSQSAAIMARGLAMIVNLEHIKAIITAEEALILNPVDEDVAPFVSKLKGTMQSSMNLANSSSLSFIAEPFTKLLSENPITPEKTPPTGLRGDQPELPFEFRVLELVLEAALTQLDRQVKELLVDGASAMEDFRRNVSSESLERVRSVKARMTRLTARVQNVREELEQLLDDDDDMRDLYLTRKQQLSQMKPLDSPSGTSSAKGGGSVEMNGSEVAGSSDVEDLEMLLEAYFMQADGYLNKLVNLREFIDDTEDIVNIELDHRRNQLIEFKLNLTSSACVIGVMLVFLGAGSMNVPFWLFDLSSQHGFNVYVGVTVLVGIFSFVGLHVYFRWWHLLGS